MRDRDAQADAGHGDHPRPDGGMTVQVDVVLLAAADLGPLGSVDGFALGELARLPDGHIALMEGNVTARTGDDIDLAALALRAAFMLPAVERFALRQHDDIVPPGLAVGLDAGFDRFVLHGPEGRDIGEKAVVAEQVGDDAAAVAIDIEQRSADRDRHAAEHPRLQGMAGWTIAVRIVEQSQPLLLLRLGREGQMPHGGRVDLTAPIEVADAREQIAQRERPLHLQLCEAESGRDMLGGSAFAHQPGEAFPAGHFIGIEPGDILDQRRFERRRVVASLHHRAG